MKSTEVATQDAVLLKQELHQLRTSDKPQKEKMTRAFIQDKGRLTGAEGLQGLREREKTLCKKIHHQGHGGLHGAVIVIRKVIID